MRGETTILRLRTVRARENINLLEIRITNSQNSGSSMGKRVTCGHPISSKLGNEQSTFETKAEKERIHKRILGLYPIMILLFQSTTTLKVLVFYRIVMRYRYGVISHSEFPMEIGRYMAGSAMQHRTVVTDGR